MPGDGFLMKRLLLLFIIATAFVIAWRIVDEIPLLVIGQPSAAGLLQKDREVPFFNSLREASNVPFKVTYRPLESVGFKDTHQLQMIKEGIFDLVSLRFMQNSEAEPGLLGIDLVGLNSDYETARKVIQAYSPTVDRYLQERFNAKLLGIWTFGPQEFFCRKPVKRLEDLKGMRVRVGSASLSGFITELGGSPVVIPFDETKNALAAGLIDCAISSAPSANHAGWPEHATYYFPLAVHFGLNGYVISLKKWNKLSHREQERLQGTFNAYHADLWKFTQDINHDAFLCNTGDDCRYGKRYRMELLKPSAHDVQLLREITKNTILPEWGTKCQKVHPGCMDEWQNKLSALFYQSQGQSTSQ